MKEGTNILNKIGKEPGFKVPQGYFDNFSKEMMSKLPEKEIKSEPKTTTWLRMRPFVYMAAMFAGVWLMMQIFADMKQANSKKLGFNPDIANAMGDEKFVDDLMMVGDLNEFDILNELYDEGIDADVFNIDSLNVK